MNEEEVVTHEIVEKPDIPSIIDVIFAILYGGIILWMWSVGILVDLVNDGVWDTYAYITIGMIVGIALILILWSIMSLTERVLIHKITLPNKTTNKATTKRIRR